MERGAGEGSGSEGNGEVSSKSNRCRAESPAPRSLAFLWGMLRNEAQTVAGEELGAGSALGRS